MPDDDTDATKLGMAPLVSGPYVTLAAVVAVALATRMFPELPNPSLILLMVVVYATFSGGLRGGFISAGIVLAYALAAFAQPAQAFVYAPPEMGYVAMLLLTVPTTVLMVGFLGRRAARAVKLQVANTRLQELDALKTQFINNAAHELRTPLTPIKTQMHILKSAEWASMNDKQQRALSMMDRNIERLNLLVQDLLEVARLQTGRLPLDLQPLDLGRLAAEAVDSFREPARESGLSLEMPDGQPVHVQGDPKRLIQVMFNLLSNACKFTPRDGSIRVLVERDGAEAVVRVLDTGRGMKSQDIQKLFAPFTQVHDPNDVAQPGSGLGLYICRGIVEQHGGTIWVESDGLGKGATVAFRLPLLHGGPRIASGSGEGAPRARLPG
ncbi:MAG TPA: HAMP domain-containing sensor histidine kinase [Candidatus Thermoplasmatota archaeon]|nr:HAMP domain-containing sensor histidine kinase [Candidatus Thermoplasmatota archaeon]